MLPEAISALPGWLLAGVALGAVAAVGLAAVFAVGVRAFPDRGTAAGERDGGERRRRAEIRRYLSAIDEPFREDYPVAGRAAAFYLPDRGVAITFDAQDYFRFERAAVQAVLLEYELPGANLGSRLPFETPDPPPGGSRGSARASRSRDVPGGGNREAGAFRTLGLSPDASEDAVRAAYRERVKEVHPDHGGDIESFRRLREAYTVARERAD